MQSTEGGGGEDIGLGEDIRAKELGLEGGVWERVDQKSLPMAQKDSGLCDQEE